MHVVQVVHFNRFNKLSELRPCICDELWSMTSTQFLLSSLNVKPYGQTQVQNGFFKHVTKMITNDFLNSERHYKLHNANFEFKFQEIHQKNHSIGLLPS